LRYLQLAVQRDPGNFTAQISLGDAYFGLKKYDQAFSIYTDLFLEFKDSPLITRRLSLCYEQQGKKSSYLIAIELMKEYLILSGDTTAADLTRIGSWYYTTEQFDSAKTYFSMVVQRDSLIPQAHLNMGLALYQLQRLDEAEREVDLAYRISQNSIMFSSGMMKTLGAIQIKRKRYRNANHSYRRALELDPTDVEVVYSVAYTYDLSHRTTQAIQWYKRTLKLGSQRIHDSHFWESARARLDSLQQIRVQTHDK